MTEQLPKMAGSEYFIVELRGGTWEGSLKPLLGTYTIKQEADGKEITTFYQIQKDGQVTIRDSISYPNPIRSKLAALVERISFWKQPRYGFYGEVNEEEVGLVLKYLAVQSGTITWQDELKNPRGFGSYN